MRNSRPTSAPHDAGEDGSEWRRMVALRYFARHAVFDVGD
jgi:hypothetical protein